MRVVHALARPGLERPAARDHRPRRRAQRVERRLLERGGVDVRRERLAVDGDVDPALVLVGDDLHPPSLTPPGVRGSGVGVWNSRVPSPEPPAPSEQQQRYPAHGSPAPQLMTMSRFESSNMTLRPLCIAATGMPSSTERL